MYNNQIALILTLMILNNGTTSPTRTKHTIFIRTPHDLSNACVSIINDNNHIITQYNNNTLHAEPSIPTISQPASKTIAPVLQPTQLSPSGTRAYSTLFGGAVVIGCASLVGSLYIINTWIMEKNAWSSWYDNLSLSALTTVAPQQLAQELFKEVKKRYAHIPTDSLHFLDPLVAFMNKCNKELYWLEKMLTIRSWLASSYVQMLVPGNAPALKLIKEKISRIHYLKQILITWLNEYSLDEQAVTAN